MLRSSSGDSCRLWLSQPLKPGDSLTAQLAAKVEAAREQVQQYAQAADVAALTAHYAVTQASQQVRAPWIHALGAYMWKRACAVQSSSRHECMT